MLLWWGCGAVEPSLSNLKISGLIPNWSHHIFFKVFGHCCGVRKTSGVKTWSTVTCKQQTKSCWPTGVEWMIHHTHLMLSSSSITIHHLSNHCCWWISAQQWNSKCKWHREDSEVQTEGGNADGAADVSQAQVMLSALQTQEHLCV